MNVLPRRVCAAPECRGRVDPTVGAPDAPAYWVRLDDDDRWIFSRRPPVRPQEITVPFGYRCARCGTTLRLALDRAQPLNRRNAF